MGDKAETLEALSKLTTGSILALILGFQIWNNYQKEQQWNERLGALMEQNATTLAGMAENAKELADALVRILEERND